MSFWKLADDDWLPNHCNEMLTAASAAPRSELVTDYFTEEELLALKEKIGFNNENHTNQIYYKSNDKSFLWLYVIVYKWCLMG